ncbi:MAG: hypothetical protein WA973_00510 [Mesorhizobium sp.]
MTQAFTHIRTADGTVLARDPITGVVASGRTLDEAFAELRRLVASHAHEREAAA